MRIILALTLVAFVSAQVPKPCESPKAWEGNLVRVGSNSSSTEPRPEERLKISYDEENQRIRIIGEFDFTPTPTRQIYEDIFLHKEQKSYRINLTTRQCTVGTLTEPFRPFGVPTGAQFSGFATIGAAGIPNESMNIQEWYNDEGNTYYLETLTVPDCVPVQRTKVTKSPFAFETSSIFDITPGIKDPNVFMPPEECNKS